MKLATASAASAAFPPKTCSSWLLWPVTKNGRDTRVWPFLSIVRLIYEANFAQEILFSRAKTFLKVPHSLRLLLSNPSFPFSDLGVRSASFSEGFPFPTSQSFIPCTSKFILVCSSRTDTSLHLLQGQFQTHVTTCVCVRAK